MPLFQLLLCLITLGFGLLRLHYWVTRRNFIRQNDCQETPSLTGGAHFFGLDIVYLLFKWSKNGLEKLPLDKQFAFLGSTFKMQRSFRLIICTMDPRNIQSIFSLDAVSFGNHPLRHFAFSPLVGDGVMTMDGASHERARALIRPIFSRTHIENEAVYNVHVQKLIDLLPKDGSTIDLQPLFERLDLDSSTEFIFGESVASLDAADSLFVPHKFPTAFNIAQKGMGVRLRMLQFDFLHRDKMFWESCRTIRQFVKESVQRALLRRRKRVSPAEKSYVLVDNLIEATPDLGEIQDTLMNVFLPGHDTIGILLSNIFFHLARNRDVWHKLRQEVLGLTKITKSSLGRLEYIHHVINETLRLNPPVSNMTRIALKDTTLPTGGGPKGNSPVFVPQGTILNSSFQDLHRLRDIYGDDTEKWRPSRWEDLQLSNLAWKFLPFSGGPHVCPAKSLALNRVAFTVAKIVRAVDRIENRDPVQEYVPAYKLVTASQNGVKVALYKTAP
ncbi:putative N-alkane-inducible cytochrome P450 [Talaromyces proteolyticus]|uniref:N-alkane-inducible cytochrome P450 n=1 Tax=Talaromyces proteolyticus TaxID=1131652 RepID=A0AAD4PY37_9EURO|nr:putative N-alkane-inducible cytochrome P450 [Talaromyces proteolyticus]KAH8700700.1 putative N-alkane-inducible cytochrome P450 [Talaromyces proteolyticus]